MCRLNQRVVILCFDCFTKTSPDVKIGREGNIKNIQLSFISIFLYPIVTWLRGALTLLVLLLSLSAKIPNEYKRITTLLFPSKHMLKPINIAVC